MASGIELFQMTGRVAIVTGGSKGLGLAMARGLASAGGTVILVSRHLEDVRQAGRTISDEFQTDALGLAGDVTQPADMQRIAREVHDRYGRIDVLINNAGINIRGPIEERTLEEFRQVQSVNVEGVWLACQAVVPYMRARKYGRILNVSSALGVVGLGDRSLYCSSKGAVVQLTRALAIELAPFAITVNALLPGPFLTEMNLKVKDDAYFLNHIVGATAFQRVAQMHEIEGPALFLCSDAASYVTGAALPVDGGWTAK